MCGDALVRFHQHDGSFGPWVLIPDMLYVPQLKVNILSKNLILRRLCTPEQRLRLERKGESYVMPQGWEINVREHQLLDTVILQTSTTVAESYPVLGGQTQMIPNAKLAKQSPLDYIGARYRKMHSDGSYNDGTIIAYESSTKRWTAHHDDPVTTDDGDKIHEEFNPTELDHEDLRCGLPGE